MRDVSPLAELGRHHADTEASLRGYFAASAANPVRFAAYKQSEVNAELNRRISETEKRSALATFARIEAAFMADYSVRLRKGSDALSIALRRAQSSISGFPSLKNDILHVWTLHSGPNEKRIIKQVVDVLPYRHWLAHGRHWTYGKKDAYVDVYVLAEAVLIDLGLKE